MSVKIDVKEDAKIGKTVRPESRADAKQMRRQLQAQQQQINSLKTKVVTGRKTPSGGTRQRKLKDVNSNLAVVRKGYRQNKYFTALIDPHNCEPTQYPDENDIRSTCWKSKIVFYPSFATGDLTVHGQTWKAGSFIGYCRPSIVDPVVYLKKIDAVPPSMQGLVKGQSRTMGLFPCNDAAIDYSSELNMMTLSSTTQYIACRVKCYASAATTECVQVPFKGTNPVDGSYMGYVGNFLAGKVTLVTDGTDLTGKTINLRVLFADNTPTNITATGGTASQYTFTLPAMDARTPPGVGFSMNLTGAAAGFEVGVLSIAIDLDNSVGSGTHLIWQTEQIPDYHKTRELFTQYRVVSMDALLSYVGPVLDAGGSVAGFRNPGGEAPGFASCDRFENISELANSYTGPAVKGTYGVWNPSQSLDMRFTPLTKYPEWDKPYLCLSAITADLVNPNTLKFECAINFEATSTSQLIWTAPSRVAPQEIVEAEKLMKTFPAFHENWLHLKDIKDALSSLATKVKRGAQDALQFWDDNKSWMIPAGQAIGAAAMSL